LNRGRITNQEPKEQEKSGRGDILTEKIEEISNHTSRLYFYISVAGIALLILIAFLSRCGILFPNSPFVKVPFAVLGILFAGLIAVTVITLKGVAKKQLSKEKSKIYSTYAYLVNILLFALLFAFLFYTIKDSIG